MESRILQLIAALRASGVRVSLAESAEAFSAVDLMGIQDREAFPFVVARHTDQGSERHPHIREIIPTLLRVGTAADDGRESDG